VNGSNYNLQLDPAQDFSHTTFFVGADGNGGTVVGGLPPALTATNQSVAYNASVPLSSIFSVTGSGITQYQVWFSYPQGGDPADGEVTSFGVPIAADQWVTVSSLTGISYIGGANAGNDHLWLRAFNGEWSSAAQAVLTDPGTTPDTITAHNQSAAYSQAVGLSSIFSVTGPTPTDYQVWFAGPSDGSVTDIHGAIATNTAVDETSLSVLNYVGGAMPGSDTMWLRAFDGQWSSWVQATLTDPGVPQDTITATSQSVAYNQVVGLSSIFSTAGPTPTQYQVWLNPGADGLVADSHGAIATGTSINETYLSSVNYIGGAMPGSDSLYVRSFDGQWSPWILATLTDPGVPADTITGHNLSVAANQSVALASIFAVSGTTPTQYQVWLSSPADGSVTDGIGAIATGTAVNETSLSGVNFIGGTAAGSDSLFVRSFDGQWSGWAKATLTDIG